MPRNILVMNLTRMGDLIQSTPLIAGLREKHPEASITLMVAVDFAEFASRIPCVDDIMVYDCRQFNRKKEDGGYYNWVEVYRYLENFLRDIQRRKFDLIFNLSHSKLSALMISYLGIENVRGFFCNKMGDRMTHHPWLQYFGTEIFNRVYNSFNLAEIYVRAGEVEPPTRQVAIKTFASDSSSIDEIVRDANIQDDDFLIGIQSGSSLENRRWPAQSFAELGDLLSSRLNAKIVLLGVESEAKLAEQILDSMKMKRRVVNLAGKTTIPQLIAILRRCRYLVTNDTGTMHIAAAVGTTIVGLFFAHAHPYETGPYGAGHIIFHPRIPCAPCSYGVQCNHVVCVEKAKPEDVYSLMESHDAHGTWKVPDNLKKCSDELNIVQTGFDKDHLLKLTPLIQRPVTKQDVLVQAYRRLWQESLADKGLETICPNERLEALAETIQVDFDCGGIRPVLEELRLELEACRELVRISEEGAGTARKIIEMFSREKVLPDRMQEWGEAIARFDDRIDLLGMIHPSIKPIADMFNKRKENFYGDDIALLAGETETCYRKLGRESAAMVRIIVYLTEYFDRPRAAAGYAGDNSINVAVAGRYEARGDFPLSSRNPSKNFNEAPPPVETKKLEMK